MKKYIRNVSNRNFASSKQQQLSRYFNAMVEVYENTKTYNYLVFKPITMKHNISSSLAKALVTLGYLKRKPCLRSNTRGRAYEYRWMVSKPTIEMAKSVSNEVTRLRILSETAKNKNQIKLTFSDNKPKTKSKTPQQVKELNNHTSISIFWGLIKIKKG